MVQRGPFRGACARPARDVLRLAERTAVQYASVRLLDALLQGPGVVAQYDALVFLLVATSLILSYYSGSSLRRPTDNRTRLWTIALAELVFMPGAMFVINGRDGFCPRYHTQCPVRQSR